MIRKLVGWFVSVAYALVGARRRVVRRLKAGAMLPVVVHALPAWQLDRILAWLKRNGVLDRLWLTFDDGWTTLKKSVVVLEKYNVRAKVFVAPGQTFRGNVWTQEANQLCIENHTWSHLSAPHRPVDEVAAEVEHAQETLAEWTGRNPEWLAWPFGRGTPELDAKMRELGLGTVYTRQGYEIGQCRNMALEDVSFQENLARVLGAWPKVGETPKKMAVSGTKRKFWK